MPSFARQTDTNRRKCPDFVIQKLFILSPWAFGARFPSFSGDYTSVVLFFHYVLLGTPADGAIRVFNENRFFFFFSLLSFVYYSIIIIVVTLQPAKTRRDIAAATTTRTREKRQTINRRRPARFLRSNILIKLNVNTQTRYEECAIHSPSFSLTLPLSFVIS